MTVSVRGSAFSAGEATPFKGKFRAGTHPSPQKNRGACRNADVPAKRMSRNSLFRLRNFALEEDGAVVVRIDSVAGEIRHVLSNFNFVRGGPSLIYAVSGLQ